MVMFGAAKSLQSCLHIAIVGMSGVMVITAGELISQNRPSMEQTPLGNSEDIGNFLGGCRGTFISPARPAAGCRVRRVENSSSSSWPVILPCSLAATDRLISMEGHDSWALKITAWALRVHLSVISISLPLVSQYVAALRCLNPHFDLCPIS